MKASKLKIQRMAKNFTQWELAQKIGMSESTLSKVETGRKPLPEKLFHKLCALLECDPDDLRSQDGGVSAGTTQKKGADQ